MFRARRLRRASGATLPEQLAQQRSLEIDLGRLQNKRPPSYAHGSGREGACRLTQTLSLARRSSKADGAPFDQHFISLIFHFPPRLTGA